MKTLNKVIAMMMMLTITSVMPTMAGSKKVSHFDRVEKKVSHFDRHNKHVYRPDVKACTFKVSRHESHLRAAAKVKQMKGVINTQWNSRSRELTVIYDAKVTSPRHIRHFMA